MTTIEVRNGYAKITNTWVRVGQILAIAPIDMPELPEYYVSLEMKQRNDPIEIKVSDKVKRDGIIKAIVDIKGRGLKR